MTTMMTDVLSDESILMAFNHGDCWVLASELFWQSDNLMTVHACGGDSDLWNHMGLLIMRDDSVLDINGCYPMSQMRENFPCNCAGWLCQQSVFVQADEDDWEHYVSMISGPKFCYRENHAGESVWVVRDSHDDVHRVADIASVLLRDACV